MTLVVDIEHIEIIGPGGVTASEAEKFNKRHFGKKPRSKPTEGNVLVPAEQILEDSGASFNFGGAEISPTHIPSRH